MSSRVITIVAFVARAYGAKDLTATHTVAVQNSTDGLVDALASKMTDSMIDRAAAAPRRTDSVLDRTTLGKAAASRGFLPHAGARAAVAAAPPALRSPHAGRSPVTAQVAASGNGREQAPSSEAPVAPKRVPQLNGRRAAMAGLVASMGTMGVPLGVGQSSAAERAYDMLRRSSLRLAMEEKALELDREGREVQAKSPDLAGVIGASQSVALSGAIVGGYSAFKRGVELDAQKKKVEERLVVEEKLMQKLKAVNQKLKEERRASKARAMQVVVQNTDASHDRAYESVREMLKRGRDALNRKQAAEAASLFRQALSKAEAITPFEHDLARKAMRGLAAAAQLAGDISEAVNYMLKCLNLSTTSSEKADALGFMGDLYEETGDFEMAGRYYDKWLQLVNHHDEHEAELAEAR